MKKVRKTLNKEKNALRNLIKTKNEKIVINDTDKNMGAADADKNDVIFECIRQLGDVKTYSKRSEAEIKNIISEIQTKLRNRVTCHLYRGNCTKTEADFLLSKMYIYDIPHFYIIWKILKNPIVGRPIVAGYNWILTPASIFVGHYFKEFYSKFENILTDSLSVIKTLENEVFDRNCFLFTIDFKSLYTNISVQDAIKVMKILFFRYKNVIPNAHFIIELMDLVLNSAVMKFQEEFFLQILGIVMGTNLAPILTNIYMAILEEGLHIRCKNKNIKWPELYKRFIDDGFGVIKCNKIEFSKWVSEFNNLRENIFIDKWKFGNKVAFMDLYIYSREIIFSLREN